MKTLLSALAATILAASFTLPVNAAPIFVSKPEQVQARVVETVHHRRHWRHNYYRNWRSDRYWHRRHAWRSCRYYGGCYPYRYYGYRPYYGYRNYYPRYYGNGYYPGYYGNGYYPGYYPRSGVSIYLSF
jgi:hypothetical protein